MFDDTLISVFSMVLTTDVDSIDDSIVENSCDNCVEVKVVVEIVVDDRVVAAICGGYPHITLRFPFNPPEIQGTGAFKF